MRAHKRYWKLHIIGTTIMIMFLSYTVNVAFNPLLATQARGASIPSVDLSSKTSPVQSSAKQGSIAQAGDGQRQQNPLMYPWELNATSETYQGVGPAPVDENSDEWVIGLNSSCSNAYETLLGTIGSTLGHVVNTVSIRGQPLAVVVKMPPESAQQFKGEVYGNNLAEYIEPRMRFRAQFVPNDPYWTDYQWGPQKIGADYAWNMTTGNHSILVAVIDTGVDYTHPDIAANYVPLGYDWVNNDSDPLDDHGHGTHVAGIIAAVLNNSIGIAGIANVSIMAEKGLDYQGSGYEDNLANAIIHAVDQGAKILSNSWGGTEDSSLIHDAVRYAYNNSVLVIAAAGNTGQDIKSYPAAYDEVVAVTATDISDNPTSFTSYGDWVEAAAPGQDIFSTLPTYHVTLNDMGYPMNYSTLSGTSMACPHVSGTAALIWSQFPNASRDWVRMQLRYTADDLGLPGFDKYYGYGRINARKAVEQLPPDHDLVLTDINSPGHVRPGETITINASVLDFGTNDENNVTVQLIIDDVKVNSTILDFISSSQSITVGNSWTPLAEGTYNITWYVVPVLGENNTQNNVKTKMIRVRNQPKILVLNTPQPEDTGSLDMLGYAYIAVLPSEFAAVNLYDYNLLFIGSFPQDPAVNALLARKSDIADWLAIGNGIVALTENYELYSWAWLPLSATHSSFGSGDTVNILDNAHPVMTNLTNYDLSNWANSYHSTFVSYDTEWEALAQGVEAGQPITLAAMDGAGRIVITQQDPDYHLFYGNKQGAGTLLENMIQWAGVTVQYQHELAVSLRSPEFLVPGDSTILNATVYNIGLTNETNVTLDLLINDTMVENATIAELPNGTSYTMNYLWTAPSLVATYNVTAYAPPVPDENVTTDNFRTRFVSVHYPIINPVEGQYAYYSMNMYDPLDRSTAAGSWNFTYDHYIGPFQINVTISMKDPSGYVTSGWMVVNTMNRYVESGVWLGYWYPGWVETGLSVGSTINLLNGLATVNGSETLFLGIYPIDCWELPLTMSGTNYAFWYDEVSGLWIGMDYTVYEYRYELRLNSTNVPIGSIYEHELAVTLETPYRLEPNNSTLLNATVYNIGQSTESNVTLSLIIDGAGVANTMFPTLQNGTFEGISYSWTPTAEGTYNVTAYVQPVPDENFTSNNVATAMVRVRAIKGFILFDQTHITDSILAYTTWVNNLTDRGYVVDTLTTTPITQLTLKGYDIFVVPQAHSYYYTDEIKALQTFVQNGGGLLVIGDDAPSVHTDLTSFVGIVWDWGGYSGYTSDITPHAVTEGVSMAYFGSPGRLHISGSAISLIRDSYQNIMLAVSEAEKGAVIGIADDASINDYNVGFADNLRLANNMIDWLMTRPPVASFTYSPKEPYVGEVVTFDASGSYDPDGNITSYSWDFGDNSTAEGILVTHFYSSYRTYTVNLTVTDNDGLNSTFATNITVPRTTIDVQTKVGSIHFRGETAEFYILLSSMGNPVDANITATLYYNGTVYQSLNNLLEHVGTGLYRAPFAVPLNASTGTYALVTEATYLSLKGVSIESFLLSPTLTGWDATLISVNGTLGTVKTNVGLIELSLDGINATLASIDGRTATIQSDLGLMETDIGTIQLRVVTINETVAIIKTVLGTMNGTVTDIKGNVATIIIPGVGTIQSDISNMKASQEPLAISQYATMIVALIAAAASVLSVVFLRRRRNPEASSPAPPQPNQG